MGLLQLTRVAIGEVGVLPGKVKMVTTDNLATVTVAGYMNGVNNGSVLSNVQLSTTDIVECLYSFNKLTGVGLYATFSVSMSGNVITLVPSLSMGSVRQANVTLTQPMMAAAYATPQQLIPNPASDQMILVLNAQVYTASSGHTPYATGTAPIIQYGSGGTNGQHGLGMIAVGAGLVAGDITAAANQVRNLAQFASAALTGLSGKGIYFSNATNAYTGGTGAVINFNLNYLLLPATI